MSKRKNDISRRKFLEGTGAVIAVTAATPLLKGGVAPASAGPALADDQIGPAMSETGSWFQSSAPWAPCPAKEKRPYAHEASKISPERVVDRQPLGKTEVDHESTEK